jgi:hypothetical protein
LHTFTFLSMWAPQREPWTPLLRPRALSFPYSSREARSPSADRWDPLEEWVPWLPGTASHPPLDPSKPLGEQLAVGRPLLKPYFDTRPYLDPWRDLRPRRYEWIEQRHEDLTSQSAELAAQITAMQRRLQEKVESERQSTEQKARPTEDEHIISGSLGASSTDNPYPYGIPEGKFIFTYRK